MIQFSMIDGGADRPFARLSDIRKVVHPDPFPDLSYLQQDYTDVEDDEERQSYLDQDKTRLETYGNTWTTIGIVAKAVIYIPLGSALMMHEIESPGLWGVEDDSDDKYLDEIFENEKDILLEILEKLNVEVQDA